MSGGKKCSCAEKQKPLKKRAWVVTMYLCFWSRGCIGGEHRRASRYSEITCYACRARWRSRGAYVKKLKRQLGS